MRLAFLVGASALVGASFVPTAAVAQPGGVSAACNIDANSPKELALATLNIQRARTAQSPVMRIDALKAVMKELDTKPERYAKNPAGYNYILSQVLVLFSLEPTVGFMSTRGAIGMVTQPEQPYDLVAHLDDATLIGGEEVVVEQNVPHAHPLEPAAHGDDVVDAVEAAAPPRRRAVTEGARERAAA